MAWVLNACSPTHGVQETELSGRQLDPWGHALEPGPGTREAGFPFGFYEASSPPPSATLPPWNSLATYCESKWKLIFLRSFDCDLELIHTPVRRYLWFYRFVMQVCDASRWVISQYASFPSKLGCSCPNFPPRYFRVSSAKNSVGFPGGLCWVYWSRTARGSFRGPHLTAICSCLSPLPWRSQHSQWMWYLWSNSGV